MRFLKSSYATRVRRYKVSELAGSCFRRHKGLKDGLESKPIKNRVQQKAAAGKLTTLWSPHAIGVAVIPITLLTLLFGAASATASVTPSPGFTIDTFALPTHLSPAHNAECAAVLLKEGLGVGAQPSSASRVCDAFAVTVTNTGSEPANGGAGGSPIVITDTLPEGVTVGRLESGTDPAVELFRPTTSEAVDGNGNAGKDCSLSAERVVRCRYEHPMASDEELELVVYLTVEESLPQGTQLLNRASVSGAGAASVAVRREVEANPTEASFGASSFDFAIDGLGGAGDAQAGDHPYELVTTFDMNTAFTSQIRSFGSGNPGTENAGAVRDIVVNLPLGFIGSTLAAPECPLSQLSSQDRCPPDTVVGHLLTEPDAFTGINSPIYNMVPERGHPAEFGYYDLLKGTHTFYTQVVPTPQGYVLQTSALQIPEVDLSRIVAVFYGDPAERQAELKQREAELGLIKEPELTLKKQLEAEHKVVGEIKQKLQEFREAEVNGTKVQREIPPTQVPFFTNPTLCSGGERVATLYIDSWEDPGAVNPDGTPDLTGPGWQEYRSESPPVAGCDQISFAPEMKVQPTTHEADTPTGLEFELKLAQPEAFGTAATSPLKNLSVTFPQGMTVDPSSADGLGTCTEAQIGWLGRTVKNEPGEEEELPNEGLTNFSEAKPECPESSKIGTLELESPLIPGKIYGEVFLAAQNANPFNSTFALYVVVNDPVTGVVIKIPGELKANAQTGQLTSVFDENPQLPFTILQVHFFGGPRAELATPPNCGVYQTNAELVPWSFPDSGLGATPFSDYTIDEDCAIGFDPAFTGGSTNLQAGAYTTFQASFERQDDDQELSGAEVNLPPGLLADISSVTECGEAELKVEDADAGMGGCPESSKVGTVESGAGPGPNPLFVPGNVFLTGPYNGHGSCTPGSETACAPYGLAVVVSANPGPFHFGNVVVRQRLFINKETAAVTDVSDPFPTYLDPVGPDGQTNGIPIKLRRVDVEINRPGFAFNPTNCVKEKYKVGGEITSVGGQSKTLSTPFQVTNCGHLKFAPSISFSTNGKTSKADGADLITKVTYPQAPQGIYSDIGYVKVELPKALPSRLTTLQKACTLAQFNANPAGCPSASDIGHVTVKTPILPGVLTGPAIFVSHGGEAFPTLTMVLQGDGVTIDLVGDTFISKSGITSTTFKTVPDSPFETFELVLPQGPYSALAANGNLCTQQLVIPNEWIAQDGTPLRENSPVTVTGCAPAIYVTKHTVKGGTATIQVKVPSAGHLTASAKGLSKGSGKATKAGTVTVKLHLTGAEVAFLAKHKGRKLEAKIHLTFSPKHGAKLHTSTTVDIG